MISVSHQCRHTLVEAVCARDEKIELEGYCWNDDCAENAMKNICHCRIDVILFCLMRETVKTSFRIVRKHTQTAELKSLWQ